MPMTNAPVGAFLSMKNGVKVYQKLS